MIEPSIPSVPSGVFWGGLTLWLGRELWGAILNRRKDKTETQANITLVNGLAQRVELLEASLLGMEKRLSEEVHRRMEAQQEAHLLRLRVGSLEHMLKGLGVVLPETH